MIKIVAIVAVVVILGVLALAAGKPNSFRVQRTTTIKAPPEKIFAMIDDFHRWGEWSPWEGVDPTMKRSYSGAERGRGAIYSYEGNSKVGAGRMEIVESASPSKLVASLDFLKPFKASNTAEFTLVPEGDATRVTWAMYGPSPFISKLMGLVFNMDKMIGGSFEEGLAKLKARAEA